MVVAHDRKAADYESMVAAHDWSADIHETMDVARIRNSASGDWKSADCESMVAVHVSNSAKRESMVVMQNWTPVMRDNHGFTHDWISVVDE